MADRSIGSLIVVGGRQRRDAVARDEWQAYDEARIVRVDPQRGEVETLLCYRTPSELCAATDPSITFKAATLTPTACWVCTATEVLRVDPRDWSIVGHWSHPWFNDLHHVVPLPDGGFRVADTGLDLILQLNDAGQVTDRWEVGTTETWERFDRDRDWRQVATTKPHESHPNFVFEVAGNWWATRFLTGDAIALDRSGRTIRLSDSTAAHDVAAGPHDGVVAEDRVWFTTVDGTIVRVPCDEFIADRATSLAVSGIERCRLRSATAELSLGWCRGLLPLTDGTAWVGFSRLRPTRFRSHVSWLKHGLRKVGQHATAATRIARHDMTTGEALEQIDLEPHGIAAIFSIHAGA